ncbi:MAG: hypothetical protein EB121_07565, partial [Alphaproteobacteria bacterium]|nr:hypothetical protein [Alphaproteobacteria bacterium]
KMIDGVRSFIGQTSVKPVEKATINDVIKNDTFFGLSVPDAIRKLMGMKRKPLTPAEIAQFLEEGGITHSSVSFVNTVGSVLHRLAKTDGGVVLVKRGQYGLIEWYPGYKRKNGKKGSDDAKENQEEEV